jgi:putative addiction module component (TIGR02574 family)
MGEPREVDRDMSPRVATLLAAAESLPDVERRELIELLVAGLDDAPAATNDSAPVLSEEWRQEIARRSAEYDAGREETVAWDDVKSRWKSRGTTGG